MALLLYPPYCPIRIFTLVKSHLPEESDLPEEGVLCYNFESVIGGGIVFRFFLVIKNANSDLGDLYTLAVPS